MLFRIELEYLLLLTRSALLSIFLHNNITIFLLLSWLSDELLRSYFFRFHYFSDRKKTT